MTRRSTYRPGPNDGEPHWMRQAALMRLWDRLHGLLGSS